MAATPPGPAHAQVLRENLDLVVDHLIKGLEGARGQDPAGRVRGGLDAPPRGARGVSSRGGERRGAEERVMEDRKMDVQVERQLPGGYVEVKTYRHLMREDGGYGEGQVIRVEVLGRTQAEVIAAFDRARRVREDARRERERLRAVAPKGAWMLL